MSALKLYVKKKTKQKKTKHLVPFFLKYNQKGNFTNFLQ